MTQVCPFRASGGRMPKRSEPLMAKSTWFQGVTPLRYLRMEMRRFVSSVLKPTGMEKCLGSSGDARVYETCESRPESPCCRCGLFPIGLRGLSRSGWGRIVWLPSEGPDTGRVGLL